MLNNFYTTFRSHFKFLLNSILLLSLSSCSNFLTTSENYICKDSKGTIDNFALTVQRSFFANSNLMKIPSKVVTLKSSRTICKESESNIIAGQDCRADDGKSQSLIFNKVSGKLEIYVTPTIVRRATCSLIESN